MIYNFDQMAVTLDNQPFTIQLRINEEPVQKSWGFFIVEALCGTYDDERNLTGTEKYRRGKLAEKLLLAGDVELQVEDIVLIKELVGKRWTPPIIAKLWDILDKKEVTK